MNNLIIKGIIDKNSLNNEDRIFQSWGSVEMIDRQGDLLPIDEFRPVVEKLLAAGHQIPLQDSHTNHNVGVITKVEFLNTPDGKKGLFLTGRVYSRYDSDTDVWNALKNGEYTGLSLGGKAGDKIPVCDQNGCYNLLRNPEIWEFSLVSTPANPGALITEFNKLAKSHEVKKARVYVKYPADAPQGSHVYTGEHGGKYYETEEIGSKRKREQVEREQKSPKIKVKSLKDVIGDQDYNRMDKWREGRELKELLNTYTNIASGVAKEPEINKVFDFIKTRLPEIYDFYAWAARDPTDKDTAIRSSEFRAEHKKVANNIKKLQNTFTQAKDHSDKVIAIDNFMNTAHTSGYNIVGRLWNSWKSINEKHDEDFMWVSHIPDKYLDYLHTNIGKSITKTIIKAIPIQKYISQCGDKFCVYSEAGKRLGSHSSKEDANAQLRAIEVNKKFSLADMNAYLDAVKKLPGTKQRMSNPVTRASYEGKSLAAGHWLTIDEFENSLRKRVDKTEEIIKYCTYRGGLLIDHDTEESVDPDETRHSLTEKEHAEMVRTEKKLQKSKIYIKNPSEAPRGLQVYIGEHGGKYYETEEIESSSQRAKVEHEQKSPKIDVKSVREVVGEQLYDHNVEYNREILPLLESYGNIAAGKASDDEVNEVAETIKRRLPNVLKFYEDVINSAGVAERHDPGGYIDQHQKIADRLKNLQNQFNTVKNRQDKIIAIDGFMSTAHTGGDNVVRRLWNKASYTGDVASKYLQYLRDEMGNIQKAKVYIKNPSEAPSGVKVQEGKRGGHYYESSGESTEEQKPQEQFELKQDIYAKYAEAIKNDTDGKIFDQYMREKKLWNHNIEKAMSLGKLSQQDAEKLGWSGTEQLQLLPRKLYHVTTAKDLVAATGLKTRDELNMQSGTGLGGGQSDTVSFTEDPKIADSIKKVMIEAQKVASGQIKLNDLMNQAKGGEGAKRPWWNDIYEKPNVENMQDGNLYWLLRGKELERSGMTGLIPQTPQEFIDEYNNRYYNDKSQITINDITPMGEPHEGKYHLFVRNLTNDEINDKTFEFYKLWLAYRENAGGLMDPLFFLSDTKALARINPSQIETLTFTPKPNAKGFQMSALGEWRTWSGDAVEAEIEKEIVPLNQQEEITEEVYKAVRSKIIKRKAGQGIEITLDSPQEVSALLSHSSYALLSAGKNPSNMDDSKQSIQYFNARHQKLREELINKGFTFTQVVGKYGELEDSFLVMSHGVDINDAIDLGIKYNQESIIHVDNGRQQMVFTSDAKQDDGTVIPKYKARRGMGWINVNPEESDFYTEMNIGNNKKVRFSLNFDFGNLYDIQ
jgi:phage head maturation protease